MLFSFDVTAIDIVLMVAVLVLLALFIAQKRGQVRAAPHSAAWGEHATERRATVAQARVEERPLKRRSAGFEKCIHDFGHLRNLPQNTAVPDECFGCPQVMRCLFPDQ